MKKKQRTRKNERKKPLLSQKKSESSSGFQNKSNPQSDDSGEVKKRMNAEELRDFLSVAKSELNSSKSLLNDNIPVFEIRSGTNIRTMPPERYMSNAADFAGVMVAKAIKNNSKEIEHLPTFDVFPKMRLTINNLKKVELYENSQKTWSIKFIYPDKHVDDGFVNFELTGILGGHDIKQAEQFLVMALADLMVRDGITNPENSIQQRTFVFDEASLWVNKEMYVFIKKNLERGGVGLMTLENTDKIFQQVANKLGRAVTDEKLKSLSAAEFKMLMAGVTYTLLRGVNRWPFK